MPPAIRILSFFIFLVCSNVKSQDLSIYIHLPKKTMTVEEGLEIIEKSGPYRLTYSNAVIEARTITFQNDSIRLYDMLDTLFSSKEIRYITKGDLLILSPQSRSVTLNKQIKIYGHVLNRRNKKPVPFASVYFPEESIGTITNYEGEFELLLPEEYPIDTIMISCIGYLPVKIEAAKYLAGPVSIIMTPYNIQIDELIVRPEKPLDLIKNALKNIETNYSIDPIMMSAFFREATKQDNHYISLAEAVIDIYKTSYNNSNEDMIRLKKGRKGSNTSESELVNVVVEGGLYNSMQLDIVKYGVSFLDPESFKDYEYALEKQITYRDRQTYVIAFNFKDNIPMYGYDGKIYLDAKTLAIVHAQFNISEEGLKYAKKMLVKKTPAGYRTIPKFGEYEVDYRLYNSKWHLTHARGAISIKVKKNKNDAGSNYSCTFTSASEFVITGTSDSGYEKIKYREASKPKDILFEQIKDTDKEFWGNENVILPEEPLLKTIHKLRLIDSTQSGEVLSNQPGLSE